MGEGGQIPPILKLALDCKTWNTLPIAGGYYDQPPRTMYLMRITLNAYYNFMEYEKMKKKGGTEFTNWQIENGHIIESVTAIMKELQNG